MISGVYRLDFSSGDFYIGKSIDILNRWKQHDEKFQRGTAAKLMQDAYNKYGYPERNIIKECHSDHIDILEACLINRLCPSLNGTYPEDPLSSLDTTALEYFLEHIDDSTIKHLAKIKMLKDTVLEQDTKIIKLTDNYKEATRIRSTLEVNIDYENKIKKLERSLIVKSNLLDMYKEKIDYLNLPWYKKLF